MVENFIAEHKVRLKDWMVRQLTGDAVLILVFVFAIRMTVHTDHFYLVIVFGVIGLLVSSVKSMKVCFGSLKAFCEETSLYNAYSFAKKAYEDAEQRNGASAEEKRELDKAEQAIIRYMQK